MLNDAPAPSPAPLTNARATRRRRWRVSLPLAAAMLVGLVLVAVAAPLPSGHDAARAAVVDEVHSRLPGWHVERASASWEGAWTIVASCGSGHVGFQFVPGHGLGPTNAWLHPEDLYSRDRLAEVSDDAVYLVWFGDAHHTKSLSCRSELARRSGSHSGGLD